MDAEIPVSSDAEFRSVIVPAELDRQRADRVIAVLSKVPRSIARAFVDDGLVTIDGKLVQPADRVMAGDELRMPINAADDTVVADPNVEFEVLYDDADLAVINKPPGLVVHRGAGNRSGTLVNGLVARYPTIVGVGENPRWGIVHRLDRDTSGAMMVALTDRAYVALSKQIKTREVHRHYTTLVGGRFPIERGTIDAPIGRDPGAATKMAVLVDGKFARTHYRRVAEWPTSNVSLVEVQLETGRTHQIRVHMAAIDHAVVGDSLYRSGPDPVACPRMFLHAHRLEFVHPFTGEAMAIDAPLASDLQEVLNQLTA